MTFENFLKRYFKQNLLDLNVSIKSVLFYVLKREYILKADRSEDGYRFLAIHYSWGGYIRQNGSGVQRASSLPTPFLLGEKENRTGNLFLFNWPTSNILYI